MMGQDFIAEDDIQQLPLWARVAFAARCGRRAQPLIRIFWQNAPAEVLRAFDTAVALAEESAAAAKAVDGLEQAVRDVEIYAGAAAGIMQLRPYGAPAGSSITSPDRTVRASAAHAAAEAAKAALAAGQGNSEGCTHASSEACYWALRAMQDLRVGGGENVLRYDFHCLKQAFEQGQLEETGGVTTEVFALEKELRTYHRLLPTLLAEQGKYVVIRGDQLAGTWETYEDALQAAYSSFGLAPFLVKRIQGENEAAPVRGMVS